MLFDFLTGAQTDMFRFYPTFWQEAPAKDVQIDYEAFSQISLGKLRAVVSDYAQIPHVTHTRLVNC